MDKTKENIDSSILHIDVGNQSIVEWLYGNKYIVFSEIVRYSEKLINSEMDYISAIMVSNLADNIVFIIRKDSLKHTLDKAMEYFLEIEEYEQCGKIRDLLILISNRNQSIKDYGRAIKKSNS